MKRLPFKLFREIYLEAHAAGWEDRGSQLLYLLRDHPLRAALLKALADSKYLVNTYSPDMERFSRESK